MASWNGSVCQEKDKKGKKNQLQKPVMDYVNEGTDWCRRMKPHTLTKHPDKVSHMGRTVQVFHSSTHSYTRNAIQKPSKGFPSHLNEFAEIGITSFWEHQNRGWRPSTALLGYVWVSWNSAQVPERVGLLPEGLGPKAPRDQCPTGS